ncbi:unnamed protein product [Chilo suppressalis]|uniref:General transcription factor 3C polypeptide 3 n=1 Tax=Chilo suppressalis TaxID=168631 RepID=A0ABN8BDL6_CHISP|nr:unnamed protein product [Chilo suppressalis]
MDKYMSRPEIAPGDEDNTALEVDLTNKFLNGELSFAEYSSEWYCADKKDDFCDNDDRLSDEDAEESPSTQSSEKVTRRRKVTRLTPALMGLMGEANLRFARGDKDMAEKMCHEIIKQVPAAAEPYQTLAQIYEDDPEKSLQFSLLAAHLSPSDANEWLRLAAISKQRNDIKQEMICYTQAINADPKNIAIHLKRLEVLTMLEESKYPLNNINRVKCYHRIVTALPSSEGDTIMKYARLASTMYHNNNEIEKTLEVMTNAYEKCSKYFTAEDLNILLELLITKKAYKTCIEIFVGHVGVEIEAEIQTIRKANDEIEEQTHYLNCTIPDNLPIDLRSKLLVCFVHLGAINLVQTLLQDFLSNDVEKAGDLYMDIEEALSTVGYHELAMQLLEPLVQNTSFDLGAVWLKHAECLYKLGRENDAIESYYKVLKHAPQHPTARKKLFTILEKKGSINEALEILQQDYKYVVNAGLLYEQYMILKKYNRPLKYLEVGEALLSKTFPRYRHQSELKIALRTKGAIIELIHNFRAMRGENPFNENDIHFDEEEDFKLTAEEEWLIFKDLMEVAHIHKQYSTMQRLSYGAIMSKALAPHRKNLEFLCFQSCLLNNDYINAMRFIREIAHKIPGARSWTLLNFVLNAIDEYPQVKFLYRLFEKDCSMIKKLFLGNHFITSGRYLVALKYFLEYHEQCKEPISALLVAITSLVMAAQKTMDKHHNLVLQGLCYLSIYHKLRKCNHESYYNIGRAFQMLNINNLAIAYYEKVLNSNSIAKCAKHGAIDLKKEAAYNLVLLYKGHSPQMARRYLNQYLVIE